MIKIFDLNNCELSYKNASYGGQEVKKALYLKEKNG